MEIASIGTDLLIASQDHISDLLFRGTLVLSLSVGFVFAFPVNVTQVYFGVTEGMENPRRDGIEPPRGTGTDPGESVLGVTVATMVRDMS